MVEISISLRSSLVCKNMRVKIIERVIVEEDKKPESVWDFVQGMTAVARDKTRQDERVILERRAGRLLNIVT